MLSIYGNCADGRIKKLHEAEVDILSDCSRPLPSYPPGSLSALGTLRCSQSINDDTDICLANPVKCGVGSTLSTRSTEVNEQWVTNFGSSTGVFKDLHSPAKGSRPAESTEGRIRFVGGGVAFICGRDCVAELKTRTRLSAGCESGQPRFSASHFLHRDPPSSPSPTPFPCKRLAPRCLRH